MNKINRLVTVVFADGYHTLELVEVPTEVRHVKIETGIKVRVDKTGVEASARTRLSETGRDPDNYDFVGILATADDPLARGRIVWAEEVEATEAVGV